MPRCCHRQVKEDDADRNQHKDLPAMVLGRINLERRSIMTAPPAA